MMLDGLPQEISDVVARLDLTLSIRTVPEIQALLGKTVLFRGKKLRPTLCFLVGQLMGLSVNEVKAYARAAEFVHAATLAHDDVIDESPIRRKRPTLNSRASNARAVLAGDLLLARVMSELSRLGRMDVIADLADTIEALVSGEWLQLEARGISSVNRQHLETVASQKTARLMSWCCTTPIRLVGGDAELLEAGASFGESLGVAFQMIDDIIDFDQGGEKPFAQDIREGLVNFVALEMLEHRPDLMKPIQRILGQVPSPQSASQVRDEQVRWPWEAQDVSWACSRVRGRAQAKLEKAEQDLERLGMGVAQLRQQAQTPGSVAAQEALKSILGYLKERVR